MSGGPRFRIALLLVALMGFVALSYEILWVRVYSFASAGDAEAFPVLLGSYLLGIALGSALSRRYCRSGHDASGKLGAVTVAVLAANVLGFLLIPAVAEGVRHVGWAATLPLVVVVAALLGAGFPLVAHFGIPAGDGRVGSRLSYLYLGNILGSTAGSLTTGLVLMDRFGLATISVILAVTGLAIVALMVLLCGLAPAPRARALGALGLAVIATVVGGPTLLEGTWEKLLFREDYVPGTRFAHVIETKSGVITVTEDDIVYGGGAYDGRFNVDPIEDENWITRPYSLAALHPAPKNVLVIGLGSGSWSRVVSDLPGVVKLTIIEINAGYLDLLDCHPLVAPLRHDRRITFAIDDGRRWLNRHDDRFDLIVQNTTHHWRAHITNLVSTEYLALIRRHLAPGGVFLTNCTQSEDVERTTASAFPYAWQYKTCIAVSDAPLAPDLDRWKRALSDWSIDGEPLFDLGIAQHRRRLDEIVSPTAWQDRATILERTRGFTLITDDNMASEY